MPILVVAERRERPEGFARFLPEKVTRFGVESIPLKVVVDEDIKLKQIFRNPKDVDFLHGVIRLKDAHKTKDQLVLRDAYYKLWPYIVSDPKTPDAKERRKAFAEIYSQSASSERWYPQIVSKVTDGARIVLWFSEKNKTFLPGIFCPDWKTAVFVHSVFGRIRSCPKCNTLFIPPKRDMLYCSPAHREAHRVARWRALKKGRTHGSSKKK